MNLEVLLGRTKENTPPVDGMFSVCLKRPVDLSENMIVCHIQQGKYDVVGDVVNTLEY